MHLKKILPLMAGLALFPATAEAQPPAFSWSWADNNMGNAQCVRRATSILSGAGFRDIDTVGDNVDTSISPSMVPTATTQVLFVV